VNEVIVTNTRSFEDIIARLRRLHVEQVVQCRCQWAEKEYQWRQLRHQRAIDEFHAMIESKRFTNPSKRQEYFANVRIKQQERHVKRENIFFGMMSTMLGEDGKTGIPYDLTTKVVSETSKQITLLENEEDGVVDGIINDLNALVIDSEKDSKVQRELLRRLLHEFSAMSLPIPLNDLYEEFKSILMESKNELDDLYRSGGELKKYLHIVLDGLKSGHTSLMYKTNVNAMNKLVQLLISSSKFPKQLELQGKLDLLEGLRVSFLVMLVKK
jgi:hypothetical protein